jgi:predicted porin
MNMSKASNRASIAAGALAMVSGLAMAQSSVVVYGVVDAGLVRETGGPDGSVTGLNSGLASGSRLGFKGKEDLGNGTSAYFVLENGFNIDTGVAAQGGRLFGRQAFVGLSGAFGAVTLGRQYSPYYLAVRDVADPFCVGFAGTASNIMATNTRVDNMAGYASPKFHGFSAGLGIGFGEQPGDTRKNRALSTALNYAEGALSASLAWHQQQNASATDDVRNALLTVRYNFGVAEVSAGRADNRGLAGARSADTILGVSVPFGPWRMLASVIRHDDQNATARDASQWALGATYALSKRTDVYAAYARISNKNGAAFKVGNATGDGTGNTGANLGIRHSF